MPIVPLMLDLHCRVALLLVGLLAVAAPARAGDTPAGGNGRKVQAANKAQAAETGDVPDEVDTENLFGFTEGTDTGKKGQQEVLVDTVGRFGKRRDGPGRSGYSAAQPLISYQYDPTDNFSIEPGLWFDARDSRNIAGVPDKSFGTFNGGSVELKYQFFKRTEDRPFSVALQAEPQYARITPVEGQGADVFSVENRLIADMRLVPDALWAGLNLIYDPQVSRLKGAGAVDRSSTLSLSGTLMAKVAGSLFVGPEARYLRAYDGAFLNRFEGHAVFIGPVLHYQVMEKGFLTLAYSTQVFGHDRDPDFSDRAFNLAQFSRHNLRVRFGVEF
ncbi:hypothetical protein [Methylobacterium frigidaeris]|uniref:Outer membrane protein beta-barrel domain-containing protein n=1 Tax=Methylobacterium frigidaeris TaxID=2038277 RepID=A0AA37HEE1_9HYPH|nr:hypothetical protein [Methylobacterium frigidaeris]GJD64486.1 hypothetical protein MPEAHAMD_4669 [Methylobacterium frigidaeris]